MPDRGPLEAKPLRVKLPLRVHLDLHRERLTTGKPLCEVVEAALALYFAQRPPREPDAKSKPAPPR